MRSILFLFLFFSCQYVVCAQSTIQGQVFDFDNKKLPLPYVNVKNLNSGKTTQTNSGGHFSLPAAKGDLITFSKSSYHTDTLFLINLTLKRVFLPVSVNQLNEVNILGAKVNPSVFYRDPEAKEVKLIETDDLRGKKNNDRAGGLKLNLGYGKYRESQKKKQRLADAEVYEDEINANFTPAAISKITKLEGDSLKNFIYLYKPSAGLVENDSPFNYTLYIIKAFSTWKKLPPEQRKPPALPKLKSN